MLSFTVNSLGDMAVFECKGRLTVESAGTLKDAVRTEGQGKAIVLDLKQISDIDAAGLGVLTTLSAWAHEEGADLKLMNLMPRVEKVLELTRLKPVFRVCSARDLLDLWCRALNPEWHRTPRVFRLSA
ncbi:MAG: STAS domain-containing protein [Candidatus Angelobacter sp.]